MPVITLSGFFLAALIAGAAITESLFSRPGVGRLLVDASNTTDVPVVIGITIVSALFYVIASIAVDLVGAIVDPRTVAR
jgi:peptide/nickel transport system permease protein